MNSSWLVLILCALALLAFFVNKRKKLPKPVFLFFAVAIIVSICWYSFDLSENAGTEKVSVQNSSNEKFSVIFVEAAHDVSIASGENRFALPIFADGKKEYLCLRFVFDANDINLTEQSFLDAVQFSLIYPDGTLNSAAMISFMNSENANFPKSFGLDVLFVLPKHSVFRDVRCIVENKTEFSFKVSNIFVGTCSSPVPEDLQKEAK